MSMQYTGESMFRTRVLLSCLSRRVLKMTKIRDSGDYRAAIGLKDYEASLLRLVDKLTDGTKIAINETGTNLRLVPGEVVGGEVEHTIPKIAENPENFENFRGFSYFLEFAMFLGLFGKRPLHLRLSGNFPELGNIDNGLEIFKSVTVPAMNRLLGAGSQGSEALISLKVEKTRKFVDLHVVPLGRAVTPVQWTGSEGKVKRIRGVAWTSRCSSQFTGKLIEAARGILNPAISDVWVFSDAVKDGQVESVGLALVAETDGGVFKGASGCVVRGTADEAEELGVAIAGNLLAEIANGGMIDLSHQWMAALVMAISADHKVGRVAIGQELSPYTAEVMKLVKDFFGVKFRFASDNEGVVLECVGCGLLNLARKTF